MTSNNETARNKPCCGAKFQTSSFCNSGHCVAVARPTDNDSVMVRDTKTTDARVLTFTRSEWTAFVKGVKNNEFDVS